MMSLLSLAPAPKQLLNHLGHPFSPHHSHTAAASKMAEVEVIGYKVERNTVPVAQIQALVVQIERGLEVSTVRDKWTEFKSPVEAIAVRNEFMKVSSNPSLWETQDLTMTDEQFQGCRVFCA